MDRFIKIVFGLTSLALVATVAGLAVKSGNNTLINHLKAMDNSQKYVFKKSDFAITRMPTIPGENPGSTVKTGISTFDLEESETHLLHTIQGEPTSLDTIQTGIGWDSSLDDSGFSLYTRDDIYFGIKDASEELDQVRRIGIMLTLKMDGEREFDYKMVDSTPVPNGNMLVEIKWFDISEGNYYTRDINVAPAFVINDGDYDYSTIKFQFDLNEYTTIAPFKVFQAEFKGLEINYSCYK